MNAGQVLKVVEELEQLVEVVRSAVDPKGAKGRKVTGAEAAAIFATASRLAAAALGLARVFAFRSQE